MLRRSLLRNSFRTIVNWKSGETWGGCTKLSSPRRYIASGLCAFAALVSRFIAFSKLSALESVDEDNSSSWEEYCKKDNDFIKSNILPSRRIKIDDEGVSEWA